MSIQSLINEIQAIHFKIKEISKESKILRNRAKNIEKMIAEYLDSKQQIGIKYKDISVVLENKLKKIPKKKKEQDDDSLSILRERGMNAIEAENLLKKLSEARQGIQESKTCIKFKILKENE